jgi:hypothetical protein
MLLLMLIRLLTIIVCVAVIVCSPLRLVCLTMKRMMMVSVSCPAIVRMILVPRKLSMHWQRRPRLNSVHRHRRRDGR